MGYVRIIVYVVLILMPLCSKTQPVEFERITIANGLPHSTVRAIVQDDQGFMWFGTGYGLSRYDGHKMVRFYHNPKDSTSIPNNFIITLFVDSRHNLWIGTRGGVCLYNQANNKFTNIFTQSPSKKKDKVISAIHEDAKGNIWIGGEEMLAVASKGSTKFVSVKIKEEPPNSKVNMYILDIFSDEESNIWAASSTGLRKFRFNGSEYVEKVFTHNPNNPNSLSTTFTSSILACESGNLWIGTNEGVNLFNKYTEKITRISETSNLIVRSLKFDNKDKLWIATNNGLYIMDCETKQTAAYNHNPDDKTSLSQNSIISMFKDQSDRMWLGTFWNGVNIAHENVSEFKCVTENHTNPSSLSSNLISTLIEDNKNNLWIGTEGGGLNYYNRKTHQYTIFKPDLKNPKSIPASIVKKLFIDKSNNLWIGSHAKGMLHHYDRRTNIFETVFIDSFANAQPQYEVVNLFEDSDNNFWVALHYGIYVFTRKGNKLLPNPINNKTKSILPKLICDCVTEDDNKVVWIGTDKGLFSYDLKTGVLKKIELNHTTEKINCITKDYQGNMWIGFRYGGLAKHDNKTRKISFYKFENEEINNNVQAILQDNAGLLWISTSNGLVNFNPKDNSQFTYTINNGLSSNEFNINAACKTQDGQLHFGSVNGMTCFDPKRVTAPVNNFAVRFTRLVIANEDIAKDKDQTPSNISRANSVTLKYNQNTFTIEFALLNLLHANKNKYAYRLDSTSDWKYTSEPSATFINLPQGHYTLMVKGASVTGVWSKPVSLQLEILPPLWKTWWAYVIYTLLFAALSFFILRYFYLRGMLKKEASLNQVKLNFFTNISHEIRTHLTLITTPIEKLQHENQANIALSQQIDGIKNNAEKLITLVNELMDFRKAESKHIQLKVAEHDLVVFATEVFNSYSQLAMVKNIQYNIVHPSELIKLFFDKEQLYKVINNLLHNAFKFTPEDGSIKMIIEEQANNVQVHVIDNGRGIAPEMTNKIFTNYFQVDDNNTQNTGYGIGLALAKNITELHKGTLTVKSKTFVDTASNQTCFTLTLPKGEGHFSASQRLQHHPIAVEMSPPKLLLAPTDLILADNAVDNESGYTILIIDDIEAIRQLIKEALGGSYKIIEAQNGKEGWNIATEIIPDIIISDVMMPEMDGYTLSKKLKTDERCSHIPIILLTAKSSQTDQLNGLSQGVDLYLSKPFSPKVLSLSVHNILQTRERMAAKYSHQITLEPTNKLVNNNEEAFLNKLVGIIEENMDNTEFNVEKLSKGIAMSQSVLYKKLKALTGLSINELIKSIRLKRAAQLLAQNKLSIFEISLMVGFNDRKYFSKEFKKQFGKSPSEYIQSEIPAEEQ